MAKQRAQQKSNVDGRRNEDGCQGRDLVEGAGLGVVGHGFNAKAKL